MNAELQVLMNAVGFTNTTGGLRLVRQNLLTPAAGDRPNAENVLILVTDGNDNRENETLLQEVTSAAACHNSLMFY